jgi:excisionase family DNA binding protein
MATMVTGRSLPVLDDVDDDAPTREFVRPARRAARPTTSEGDELWDANDVARYLKVSRSWVYHRAEAGQLPHLRVGGLLRFDADVVRAFARRK